MYRILTVLLLVTTARASDIKSDEEVVVFPAAAHYLAGEQAWSIPLHSWIYEPEHDSSWRRATIATLHKQLGEDLDVTQKELFKRRARWFLVDNERGKQLRLNLRAASVILPKSSTNGHSRVEFTLKSDSSAHQQLSAETDPREGDGKTFSGKVFLVPPEGVSVISDIDDTIKISEVFDKKRLLHNTFTKAFSAVPGMAKRYAAWREQGAVFHYVSASPWQLYPEMSAFLDRAGFPAGTFHLKDFRAKDSSFFNLFASAEDYKIPLIENLLKRFPGRRFILVGDSTEKDPEVYGEIARRFPKQVQAIYIRKVPEAPPHEARLKEAFRDVQNWSLFEDAGELKPL